MPTSSDKTSTDNISESMQLGADSQEQAKYDDAGDYDIASPQNTTRDV